MTQECKDIFCAISWVILTIDSVNNCINLKVWYSICKWFTFVVILLISIRSNAKKALPEGFKTGGEVYAMKEKPKTTFAMLNRNLQVMVWFGWA